MVTAPEVIAELQRIAQQDHGEIRVARVVEAARAASSPLHSWFNWDDSKAAGLYREQQARQLLRVCVGYIGDDENSIPVRVFVSLESDRYNGDGGGYRVMTAVLNHAERRAELLANAADEMKTFREKYARLKELREVFASMSKVQQRIKTGKLPKAG